MAKRRKYCVIRIGRNSSSFTTVRCSTKKRTAEKLRKRLAKKGGKYVVLPEKRP